MRVLSRTAVAVLAMASFLVPVQPAQAAGGGGFVFMGDVTLPTFPCSGSGCTANFTASTVAGTLAFSDGAVGVVNGLSATVNYTETCVAGQAITGSATGYGTGSGIGVTRGINVTGTALPLTSDFSWLRVGLVAVITMVSVDDVLTGAALFIPQGGLPTCTGGSMTATVAGAATHGSPSRTGGRPYEVRAELTVRPAIIGMVSYELRNTDPPLSEWSCEIDGNTVSCRPGPVQGRRYVCEVVEATVSHVGAGLVSGTSTCPSDSATGVSPDQPHASSNRGGEVPFSCSVNPGVAVSWEVFCTTHPD